MTTTLPIAAAIAAAAAAPIIPTQSSSPVNVHNESDRYRLLIMLLCFSTHCLVMLLLVPRIITSAGIFCYSTVLKINGGDIIIHRRLYRDHERCTWDVFTHRRLSRDHERCTWDVFKVPFTFFVTLAIAVPTIITHPLPLRTRSHTTLHHLPSLLNLSATLQSSVLHDENFPRVKDAPGNHLIPLTRASSFP